MSILLNKGVEEIELIQFLRTTLPNLNFSSLLSANTDENEETSVSTTISEGIYPTHVTIWSFKGRVVDDVQENHIDVALGRHLSEDFDCDALVDGTLYGPDPGDPYYSLLWRSGEAWLADDSVTDPLDSPGEPALPLHRLSQPLPWLAQNGEILLR